MNTVVLLADTTAVRPFVPVLRTDATKHYIIYHG